MSTAYDVDVTICDVRLTVRGARVRTRHVTGPGAPGRPIFVDGMVMMNTRVTEDHLGLTYGLARARFVKGCPWPGCTVVRYATAAETLAAMQAGTIVATNKGEPAVSP